MYNFIRNKIDHSFINNIYFLNNFFFTDIFEDLVSPVVAAQLFFTTACDKRKNTLDPIMAFCIEILNQPKQDANARRRDGALHVIGSVSDILMKVQNE